MIRFDFAGLAPSDETFRGRIAAAADGFHRQGYAILDNVLPIETVAALNAEFLEQYQRYLKDEETDEVSKVGKQRYMLALRFAGRFADPVVFANPVVLALVRSLLDVNAVIEAYGAILSLPGAAEQHHHADGPPLFGDALDAMLPPYALTAALPLVEMNEHQGTTALLPRSHRRRAGDKGNAEDADKGGELIMPVVPPGSCVMWDFRLRHHGTPNASSTPRPMVYCTYSRPWYRDPVNFLYKRRLRRLDFDPAFRDSLPADLQPLLTPP